jgi:hypothetical protein
MKKTNAMIGIHEPKPARGFPAGRLRWIMRNNQFVTAAVRSADGLRVFVVNDAGEFWEPWVECQQAARIDADNLRTRVGDWIPVTESMPDDEISVLVWSTHEDAPALAFHDTEVLHRRGDSGWIVCGSSRVLLGVSHWCQDIQPPDLSACADKSTEGQNHGG